MRILRFTVLFCALGLLVGATAPAIRAAQEKAGYIKLVGGNKKAIHVWRSSKLKWVLGGKQTPLYAGDKVRTGAGAKAKVVLLSKKGEEDFVDVRPDTVLEIPDIPENEGGTSWVGMFSNAVGSMLASVKRRISGDNGFNVKTPTVVAGVRGTQFDVKYDGKKRKTWIGLREGTLNVLTIGSILAATLTRDNPKFQVDAYRAAQVALAAKVINEIEKRKARAHARYENRNHILFVSRGKVRCGEKLVDEKFWNRSLDLDRTSPEERIRLEVLEEDGMIAFSLDRTGRFELKGKGFVDLFKIGNEVFVYLQQGDLKFRREGEWRKGGNIFGRRRPSGKALYEVSVLTETQRVQDYSAKGVVTQMRVRRGPAETLIDVAQGRVKVSSLE